MAGESILVVDDVPVNLKLAAAVLRSEGYRVHLASSAEQALMMLATMRPDLMLVDIQLPGMDGLELTRRVRSDPRTHDVLVVALTASIQRGDEQNAFDAGCDGFLHKPIDTRTLGDRLRGFIEGQPVPAPAGAVAASPAGDAFAIPGAIALTGPEME